jgi:hypothetical protein
MARAVCSKWNDIFEFFQTVPKVGTPIFLQLVVSGAEK